MRAHLIGRCLDELELARALTGDASERVLAHLAGCTRCGDEANAFRRMIELARRGAPPSPSFERTEQLRTQILARTELEQEHEHEQERPSPRRRSRAWLLVGAAAVSAAVVALAVISAGTTPTAPRGVEPAVQRRGTVNPRTTARFQLVGVQPDEVVRLTDGTVHVEVAPLGAGERFRVVTSDGEVEVRGTAFDVTAANDRLRSVLVSHGRVEVRSARRPTIVLEAGQRWDAPEVAVEAMPPPATRTVPQREAQRPAPRAAPPEPRSEASPPPITVARSASERAFSEGWDALRDGDAAAAASHFEQCLALEPAGALNEDAAFWHGIALARAGRRAGATRALTHFLESYAESPRAGEASMTLGWLLLDDGDLDGAARRFRAAAGDVSATVRASAAEGLAEIARRRR